MTTASPPAPTARRGPGRRPTFAGSAIGQKVLMAVTGLLMLAFLVLHMLGNLKVFFGPAELDAYGVFLRRLGTPVLPHSGFLWLQRVGLLVVVLVHVACAYLLTRRDRRARPVHYQHRGLRRQTYAARTMRWGGVILLLFVVYHLLDMTTLTLNPHGVHGEIYDNVVSDFRLWYVTLAYTVAMLALGMHLEHGFWSAGYTLGVSRPRTMRRLRIASRGLAVLLTVGFLVTPWAVFTGVVS